MKLVEALTKTEMGKLEKRYSKLSASCAAATRKHGKIRYEKIETSVHHALPAPEHMIKKMSGDMEWLRLVGSLKL